LIDTDRIDRRYFGWTALVAGALGLALLGLYGYRTFVDLAAGNAYRHGTLTVQTASIVQVDYSGGDQTGFGSPNAAQDVLLRLNDGSTVRYSSQLPSRQHVNLSGRQAVTVGTWHSRLVTVGGVDVRDVNPGALFFFILLPPAFVLAIIHAYRLRAITRAPARDPDTTNTAGRYVQAAAILAFAAPMVTMAIDGVLWWPLPCFVVSAIAPLVWYAVAEIRSTSPTLDPSPSTCT
jgi:hypothetical protein